VSDSTERAVGPKPKDREWEIAHYTGRLYKRARELLSKNPNYYRKADALEIELVKLCDRRDYKPPKWFTDQDRDDALRDAAERARKDFGADEIEARNGAAGAADGASAAKLPVINRYNKRLRELVAEGLEALAARNARSPQVFTRAGALARIRWIDDAAQIEVFDTDSLMLVLDESADWIRDDGTRHQKAEPHERAVRAMLKLPRYQLPSLRGIAHAPFFADGGRLVAAPGYDPASEIFLAPGELTALDKVPDRPSAEHVRMAADYLNGELLADFPFATGADRANAIGLLLTPFARPMIEGSVPFHVIDSPQVGTGKSLLAQVIHIVATGRSAPTGVAQFEQSEAHKAITAILLEAAPIVLLDNISRHLMSGPLAAALTGKVWTDRVLGQSKMVTVPNRAVWIATGNNLTLSSELRRRSVEIRIDAKLERPEERGDFRHKNLEAWARENRAALVHSALTLIQNWIALSQPAPALKPFGSFENWSHVIGGILSTAGIGDFLGNAESFRQRADPDATDWRQFIDEWAAAHGARPVTAVELAPIALGLIPRALGSGNERSQHTKLGFALKNRVGQIFGEWRIDNSDCRDAEGRARHGFRLMHAAA